MNTNLIQFAFNRFLNVKGTYITDGNKVLRKLPLGLYYCCIQCETLERANRIASQLNSVK